MANESAVENVSDLKTTDTCPGCGEEINLLVEHLRVTISPSRAVIETVDAALVGAETDEEGNTVALGIDVTQPQEDGGSRERFYVGTRTGAGIVGYFHNYQHLADWATEQGTEVKITPLMVDPDAEGRSNE
jgi:hypothetical protein